ncbi:hypothetical protein Pmani_027086 [Petrolisthes manimaculis]|uniref:Carbohydrate sulfotransferase n=1 Tax=Petrolisthes manimaculis TaxID=1843537 RepID=A0AAE1P2Y2_9EUCA|nr:hypothetical protein Pmani_027086 [Petrolisthes manimaculis]
MVLISVCRRRRSGRLLVFLTLFLMLYVFYVILSSPLYQTLQWLKTDVDVAGLEMEERARRVEQTCHKYSTQLLHQYSSWLNEEPRWEAINTSLWTNRDILVDRKHSLAWCKVPKVASTSLVKVMLRLAGNVTGDPLESIGRGRTHMLLRTFFPPPTSSEDLAGFTSFMVVRHPFQRLLSAYRDKLLDRTQQYQFKKFKKLYGKAIIKTHRPRRLQRKHTLSQTDHEYHDIPTFTEFVEYLVSTPVWLYNEHWIPYYFTCTPCHHKYSIVMHMSNITREAPYLHHVTGIDITPSHVHITQSRARSTPPTSPPSPPQQVISKTSSSVDTILHNRHNTAASDVDTKRSIWSPHVLSNSNPHNTRPNAPPPHLSQLLHHSNTHTGNKTYSAVVTGNVEAAFFSQINMKQLLKLYDIYKIDFEMFGYDLKPYDSYVVQH